MGEGLIVRRSGSGGKSEGSNAWTKNIKQTATISFASTTNSGYNNGFNIYVTTTNENVKPSKNDLVGMYFRITFSADNYYLITIKSNTQATLYQSSTGGTISGTWSYNESTMLLEFQFSGYAFSSGKNVSNRSSKTISGLSLVNYVVSNNKSDYPSNGMHTDGYYYELLGSVSSTNVASLSDNILKAVQADYRNQIVSEVSEA